MGDNEGWTWLWNSRKWHYFRDKRSLCGHWGLWTSGDLSKTIALYPREKCKTCDKKLAKEQARQEN